MSKFKVGDVVVPTTEYGKKEFNGTSLVVSECNKCFVRFNNEPSLWNPDAFELVKEEVMKHDFKVGDFVTYFGWGKYLPVVEVRDNKIRIEENGHWWWYDASGFIKKEETMKLEIGGKYRKVGTHEPVRVICTDRKPSGETEGFTCVSLVTHKDFEYTCITTVEGKNLSGVVLFEEVPEVDWSKVPVDTPIWVEKEPRHFAGFSSHTEEVFYYSSGTTSHTSHTMCYGFSSKFSTHKSNCSLEKG